MTMKNEEYWKARAEQRLIEAEQIAARAEKEMKQAFDAAYKDIELQIYKLYGKYAKDNEMSYADALAYLTDDERKEFQRDLAFYIAKAKDGNYRKEYREYLQALSVRARVQRLEAYQAQLKIIAEQLYEEQIIPQATAVMQTVAFDSYLKAAFDISQGVGLLMAFDMPSQRLVNHILEYPWSGKSFSDKWYDNCKNFEAVLEETLTKGLITGASNQKIARELRDKTGASYSNAERLVRTETNFAHNQATATLYEDLGVEKYKYLATLDLRTSPMCRAMDGKVIAYKDKVDGINYPPLHPRCRSTTVAVIYEDRIGTRVARDKDGKSYKVPANMTYNEWYEQYIKGNKKIKTIPKTVALTDSIRNYSKDELVLLTQEINKVIDNYVERPTKWSGKIQYNSPEVKYGKLWNCDIASSEKSAPHIILHESLHARSSSYFTSKEYVNCQRIEEGTVQLLAEEISKKHNIKIVGSNYDEHINALKQINTKAKIADNDMDFARELFKQPMTKRIDWLKYKVDDIMLNGGTSGDYLDAIQLLRTLEGPL